MLLFMAAMQAIVMATPLITTTTIAAMIIRVAHAAAKRRARTATYRSTKHGTCAAAYRFTHNITTRCAQSTAYGCLCLVAPLGSYGTTGSTTNTSTNS
jgi:hypothetical protein